MPTLKEFLKLKARDRYLVAREEPDFMKRSIGDLTQGDWFIAELDNEPSVFVAGEMRHDGVTRFCVDLKTGSGGGWASYIEVAVIPNFAALGNDI